MLHFISKKILLFLALNIALVSFSNTVIHCQNIHSSDIHERSRSDSTTFGHQSEKSENASIDIDMSLPVTIGIIGAVVLGAIFYTTQDDDTSPGVQYSGKGGAAIAGAIVGFLAGFFISGAIMESRARGAAKRENDEFNIQLKLPTSDKEFLRFEPYIRLLEKENQFGITMKYNF